MIDTIKFLIPIEDHNLIEKLKGNLTRIRKDDLRTGKMEFEFFSSNVELGSYHGKIAIKSTETPSGFFVEFSAPKYIKGNNVEMIYPHELIKLVIQLYDDLSVYMDYKLPHYALWPIYRLDICYNWIFKNSDEAKYAMDFLRRIDFPRKKKYIYDTSVMYLGTAYIVKFYSKGEEFKKKSFKKMEIKKATELQAWADKIVRFEVGLKRVYLQQFLKIDRVYIYDVIDDKKIEEILKFYLEKKVFFYLNTNSMSNENIKQILFNNFSKMKATKLYQFYRDYYFDVEMKDILLSGGQNKSTIYRHKKDLKTVGIGISSEKLPECKNILEQLVIPSESSKFDLLEKLDILKK